MIRPYFDQFLNFIAITFVIKEKGKVKGDCDEDYEDSIGKPDLFCWNSFSIHHDQPGNFKIRIYLDNIIYRLFIPTCLQKLPA